MHDICPTTPAKLYSLGNDEYARESATSVGDILVEIQESNTWVRGGNVQTLGADALAGVRTKDLETLVPYGRCEGFLLQVFPFGQNDWYRVSSSSPAKERYCRGRVHHYELLLTRSKEPKVVCVDDEES